MTTTRCGRLVLLMILVMIAGCAGSPSNESMKLGGIDTSEVLAGLLTRTGRALDSVRDMDSARAAARELEVINTDFDDLLYNVPKLSEQGRLDLAAEARKAYPSLQYTVGQINGSEALRGVLGPVMDDMLERLGMLMQ